MPSNPNSLLNRLFPTAHRLLLNRIIRTYFNSISGRVLIVGAGNVDYSELLPNAESLLLTDVEYSDNIDCIADLLNLPFDDCSFDSVILIEVLEHISDLPLAVSQLYRVIKPSGTCYLSIPFLFHIHGDPDDFNRLTSSGLVNLFSPMFEADIKPFGSRVHVISDLVTTISRPFALLRPVNYLLASFLFPNIALDAPSGYFLILTKH